MSSSSPCEPCPCYLDNFVLEYENTLQNLTFIDPIKRVVNVHCNALCFKHLKYISAADFLIDFKASNLERGIIVLVSFVLQCIRAFKLLGHIVPGGHFLIWLNMFCPARTASLLPRYLCTKFVPLYS